ncbi:M48 family metalloprotease [Massilia sp. CCM 8733]|uniref:M48 family metalloprotease n=1 Tax=Massilia mucilaginosa TaxID=2609282 RepID=A0ABX0P1B6_9BURK|nr:M48 family metalloprotease [Massilia mucilaginosa]NHZ92734.1 M48 family metalloprotease [Massilia mucilaginosa]
MYFHRIAALLAMCLALSSGGASAVTQAEVEAGAARLYRVRIDALAQAGMLDRDAAFVARVARIAQRLGEQARRDNPAAPALSWEIHTSSDPDDNASCMAGGKILVSQAYVEQLALSDAELAMVLSHEMQHAILLHNLKEYKEAVRRDPGWLARPFSALEEALDHDARLMGQLAALNREQEVEADREGMAMAWRAGWRAKQLAAYFRKLEQAASMSHIGSASHPSALQRWRAARRQAGALE